MADTTSVKLNPSFITNKAGRRTAVVLRLKEYQALLEALEDRADLAAFGRRLAQSDGLVPWREVESNLKRKGRL